MEEIEIVHLDIGECASADQCVGPLSNLMQTFKSSQSSILKEQMVVSSKTLSSNKYNQMIQIR